MASRCWSRHGSPALTSSHSPVASPLPSLSPAPLAFPTPCAHPPGCLQVSFLELVPWASPLPGAGLRTGRSCPPESPVGPLVPGSIYIPVLLCTGFDTALWAFPCASQAQPSQRGVSPEKPQRSLACGALSLAPESRLSSLPALPRPPTPCPHCLPPSE